MNKQFLMSKMKSSGIAYLCWFFLGCHYAYMGKWGVQILYWLTLGGVGVWAFIDLFRIPGIVDRHNLNLSLQIAEIEKREKDEEFAKNLAMMSAAGNNKLPKEN